MKYLCMVCCLLVLAGCGSTSASSPTATPAPKAKPTRVALRWSRPPAMAINRNHSYSATLETTDGSFTIALLPKVAPKAVNNFIFLSRHHFYDHVLFTRIIQTFMIQTGDPTGTGGGGPGYEFDDELSKLPYSVGTVAMANHGPNTNGSQFFIVTGLEALNLPHSFTIFGRVTRGMNVVYKIARTPVTTNIATQELSEPLVNVYINHVVIRERP